MYARNAAGRVMRPDDVPRWGLWSEREQRFVFDDETSRSHAYALVPDAGESGFPPDDLTAYRTCPCGAVRAEVEQCEDCHTATCECCDG